MALLSPKETFLTVENVLKHLERKYLNKFNIKSKLVTEYFINN